MGQHVAKTGQVAPHLVEAVFTDDAAISFTVTPVSDFRIIAVLAHFASDPADGLSISLDSVNGAAYDTVFATVANAGTDYAFLPSADLIFKKGNAINVAVTNAGSIVCGVTVVYELV